MDPKDFQKHFFSRIADPMAISVLFDHLPAVYLFMKDRNGRFTRMNKALYALLGVANEAEVIGKTDYDFFASELADSYLAEDSHVMRTGRPLADRVWHVPDASGVLRWYISTKIPLFDEEGEVIGIAGAMQDFEKAGAVLAPYRQMSDVVKHVSDHYAEKLSSQSLAAMAHLSVSQFNRTFKKLFQTTPARYIAQVRIHAACGLLATTQLSLEAIAQRTGFCDASHFVKQFKRVMNETPRDYRLRRKDMRDSTGR